MPPASRGFISSSLQHGFRIYSIRPNHGQQRFVVTAAKPTLPPRSAVKAAIAQNAKAKQPPKTQETVPKKWWQARFPPIPVPSAVRRLLQRLSTPWVRRWTWRLFFFGPPLALLIEFFPVTLMHVSGPSMTPYFNAAYSPELPPPRADSIVVQKAHSLISSPDPPTLQRGQIVVYYQPHNPRGLSVKRVVGIPGDRITPLPGYPGGDEQPVIVPYNHIWIEGDANNRRDSLDSNTFGPISQNLLYGYVVSAHSAGWHGWQWLGWRRVRWQEDEYPAKKSGRIEKDVIGSAKLDPDEEYKQNEDPFKSGAAALELAMIKSNREQMPWRMRSKGMLQWYKDMYVLAKQEFESGEATTRDVAEGWIDELEVVFEAMGLNKDGSGVPPAVKKYGDDVERRRRLQEYIARQRPNEAGEHA